MSDPQQIEMPDPPYQREDYRVVWMAGWLARCRAAHAADHAALQRLQVEVDQLKEQLDVARELKAGYIARMDTAEAAVQRLQQALAQVQQCWRCFHCGMLLETEHAAREHFGPAAGNGTVCAVLQIRPAELQALLARLQSSTPQESK